MLARLYYSGTTNILWCLLVFWAHFKMFAVRVGWTTQNFWILSEFYAEILCPLYVYIRLGIYVSLICEITNHKVTWISNNIPSCVYAAQKFSSKSHCMQWKIQQELLCYSVGRKSQENWEPITKLINFLPYFVVLDILPNIC